MISCPVQRLIPPRRNVSNISQSFFLIGISNNINYTTIIFRNHEITKKTPFWDIIILDKFTEIYALQADFYSFPFKPLLGASGASNFLMKNGINNKKKPKKKKLIFIPTFLLR